MGDQYATEPPPESFYTGEWIVYSRYTQKPFLKVEYETGLKHGKEIVWYSYPDIVQTKQAYSKGVLHGICQRYDSIPNSKPLLEGEFRLGKPWNGTFLVNARREVITYAAIPLDFHDVVWFAAHYKEGREIEIGRVGSNGFEKD